MTDNRWMQTFTGRKYWPLNPRIEDICIEDIAHHLSQKVRYTGACIWLYTVGQHSCLVCDLAPSRLKLKGLMHDGGETYLPDAGKPIKGDLIGFKEIEKRNQDLIDYKYHVPDDPEGIIKYIDNRILVDERQQVMTKTDYEWPQIVGLEPFGIKIERWEPERTKAEFLKRFYKLTEPHGNQITIFEKL